MSFFSKIIHLLPDYDQVKSLYINNESSSQLTILSYCYTVLDTIKSTQNQQATSRPLLLVSSLKDKIYETINIGHWSEIDENIRKAFTVATFVEVFFRLYERSDAKSIEKVLFDLDLGLLLGCPLQGSDNTILTESIRIIEENFPSSHGGAKKRQKLNETAAAAVKRSETELRNSSIAVLQRPSLENFQHHFFDARIPALILDCIGHWPAFSKWKQPNYLLSVAGERTVPIEIGSHYTNENWSQDLVKFKEFLKRQMSDQPCDRIEYLAQHNLFDQIPALRNDISVPEYCCIGKNNETVDIKAWLGPKGTISPMHYDPKHNLLCQVFGHKTIILAAPEDSPNLYPHETEMLKNTTKIDAENVDLDAFPLCSKVKFLKLRLYEGEMLYIPPGWWHYVRSMEKSFSVSFWWD